MAKSFTIEAQVHKSIPQGYRVKVSILDIGMYINGMVVMPPTQDHKDWSVYPPSQRAGRGKYAYIVEFNKQLHLWDEIYDACVDAVKLEMSNDKMDVVITDFDEDAPINLDDIPF
jgi:hypothetical protein